jgi:hypothetical protein
MGATTCPHASLRTHWEVMGALGTGGTPQIADAQGGSGGVGIRLPLPCVEGEQLGSVAGLQTAQAPVNVPISGYGVV